MTMKKLKELKEKIANNKPLRIILGILKFVIYAFLVTLLLTIVVQKISQNKKTIGGFMLFTVASESMKGEYEVGDIIISKSVPESELKVGDNITYLGKEGAVNGLVITHKLVEIEESENGKIFTTKGLTNIIPDPSITYDQIYGKVIYKTTILSYVSGLIRNRIVYYVSFIVIGLLVSIELVSAIFEGKREDDDANE
jgi:signal peptidase I